MVEPTVERNRKRDIVVLSDLHMGRGRNRETGRFYALEAFFYDDDFLRFCRYLCSDAAKRGAALTVVLNGDVFDLLRVEHEDADPTKPLLERRYGAPHTPALAARMVSQILAGHPHVVRGLAEILRAGHEVFFLPGNHDIEVQWTAVQVEIRRAIEAVLRESAPAIEVAWAMSGLKIGQWFYYEPGRVWIEHGCQYDPENAFRYYLRGDLGTSSDAIHEAEQDMPLGNFFQRYLYNGFGHVTFIVPTSKANARYIKWLLVNQPRLLFGVLASHLPFVAQVLRRLARSPASHSAKHHLKSRHEDSLGELARTSGLGDKLLAIERLKEVNADVLRATRGIGTQLVLGLATFLLLALSGLGLWFVGLMAINALNAWLVMKTMLFMALNLFMLLTAMGALAYTLLRTPRAVPPKPIQRAAQRIIDILDVPIVTFGHTHEEVLGRLKRPNGKRAWYYNTGTWIAVFTHDVLIPRERVQYTFLRIRGDQGELLHWSPGRGEPLEVILLDEAPVDGWRAVKTMPATTGEFPAPVPETASGSAPKSRERRTRRNIS